MKWGLILVCLFGGALDCLAALRVKVALSEDYALRIEIENTGNRSERIELDSKDRNTIYSYGIWIEGPRGRWVTAYVGSEDNWNYPGRMLSYSDNKPGKKVRLKPGKSYAQEIRLRDMLKGVPRSPTEAELERRVRYNDGRLEAELLLGSGMYMELPLDEALSQRRGPYRLKVQWKGLVSNWVELEEFKVWEW